MPPTSNPSEVEDIFSAVEQPGAYLPVVSASQPVSQASMVDSTPAPVAAAVRRPRVALSRRSLILIVSVVAGVLLLGGIGLGINWWLQNRPAPVVVNTTDANVVETPPLITNTNQAPVNATNTTPPTTFSDGDFDGLSDEEEVAYNTNPKKKDTDDDGLSDREEVRVYLTDPRNPDTDGDGYTDGKEVNNFYHPNDPDPKKRLFDF